MGYARQTVERRQLGLTLKRFRERAGKSQVDAGEHIGRSHSRLSKFESGLATFATEDLERLLNFYNLTEEEYVTALTLGVNTRKRSPRQPYIDQLPDAF